MFTTLAVVAALGSLAAGIPLEHANGNIIPNIVGGVDAPEGYAAHMAALVWGETFKSLICGGSIVSKRHILTAAHCIDPMVVWGEMIPSFHAVVGSNQWNSKQTVAKFSHYVNHPSWDWVLIKNDIGILFLTTDLVLNDRIAVVPLDYGWVDGGVESYATGWGRIESWGAIPDDLQILDVTTVGPRVCEEVIRQQAFAPPVESAVEICTFHSFGHGMCNGDSGSALVSRETRKQIGIVSWGFPCARGLPDVYTRVSGFQDFLSQHIDDQNLLLFK